MFDQLKKEQAAGLGAKERMRLTLFVVVCLMLAVTLAGLQSCYEVDESTPPAQDGPADPAAAPTAAADTGPIQLDVALLTERGSRPDGQGGRTEILDTYVPGVIDYMRLTVEGEPPPGERVSPTALRAEPRAKSLGRVFDVEGTVVARVEQIFGRETQRLWSLVIQDEQGGQVVAVQHGLRADAGRGMPVDDGSHKAVYVGQFVVVRGYVIQRRTGTIGDSQLAVPTPVLWATNWRQQVERAERLPPVTSLDEIDWAAVRDHYYAETRATLAAPLFQTIQWARAQGVARIAEMIRSGETPVTEWNQDLFGRWQPEVDVRDEAPRPFTEAARGHWFKTSGLIANTVHEGWSTIPANKWGIDGFTVLDLNSDHYARTNIRTISAFPLEAYPGITGKRKEQVWIYGVFYKNHSFMTRRGRENMKGATPLTMPMFVVMYMEPVRRDLDAGKYQAFMWILAGSLVLLGLIFWLVFVRGESKEAAQNEQSRIERRRRRRALHPEARLPGNSHGFESPEPPLEPPPEAD